MFGANMDPATVYDTCTCSSCERENTVVSASRPPHLREQANENICCTECLGRLKMVIIDSQSIKLTPETGYVSLNCLTAVCAVYSVCMVASCRCFVHPLKSKLLTNKDMDGWNNEPRGGTYRVHFQCSNRNVRITHAVHQMLQMYIQWLVYGQSWISWISYFRIQRSSLTISHVLTA